MSRERMVMIGLAVLLAGALLFAGAAAGQRSAWMEGFMVGRFTAAATAEGAGAAAAVMPYAAYAPGFGRSGPGFGGFLFLLLGIGLVAFFASRCSHRARWRWMAMQSAPQGGAEGDWRHGPPPWMGGRWSHGPWGPNPWGHEQAGGQGGETSPSGGSSSSQRQSSGAQGQPPMQPGQQPPAEEPPTER